MAFTFYSGGGYLCGYGVIGLFIPFTGKKKRQSSYERSEFSFCYMARLGVAWNPERSAWYHAAPCRSQPIAIYNSTFEYYPYR
jgi:hypothetical protein